MKLAAILLFVAIVIFGLVRHWLPGETHAQNAQAKIKVLNKVQERARTAHGRPSEDDSALEAEKQTAQQENQAAQKNIASLRIIQVALTVLTLVLCSIVIRMVLQGKNVDGVVKTFAFGSMTTIIAYWFYVPKG